MLDIHPEPVNSHIEVWQDGSVHRLGEIDQSEDNTEIRDARLRLESLQDEGLFTPEDSLAFELHEHYPSVHSWQEKWAEDDYRLVATRELLDGAQRLLDSGGGELVIRERVRATRLRRTSSPGENSVESLGDPLPGLP